MRARSLAAEELLLLLRLESVSRSRYLRFKAEQVAARFAVISAFFRIFSPGLRGLRSVPVSDFCFWRFYTDWTRTADEDEGDEGYRGREMQKDGCFFEMSLVARLLRSCYCCLRIYHALDTCALVQSRLSMMRWFWLSSEFSPPASGG